jgi:hypothetical protein
MGRVEFFNQDVIQVSHLSYSTKLFEQDVEFVVCREYPNVSDVSDMADITL